MKGTIFRIFGMAKENHTFSQVAFGIVVLIFLSMLYPNSSFCQSTTLSATVVDQNSTTWKFGTYSLSFAPAASNPQAQYFWNGAPFNKAQTIAGNLDGTGSFSVSVPSNTAITPSQSTWVYTACPAASAPCFTTAITVTGATQSISSLVPPAAIVNLTNPPAGASAYTDAEIIGAKPGSFYFNLTDGTIHICQLSGFPPCTWSSQPNSSSGLPQLITQSTATNLVNSPSSGIQQWPLFCSCFAAGQLNISGKTIEMDFLGNGQWQANTGTSVSFGIYFNTTPLSITTGLVTPTGSTTLWNFDFKVYCVTTTIGSSGVVTCNLWGQLTDANGVTYPMSTLNFPINSVNLTTGLNVGAFVQFSTASSNNKATTDFFILKQDN